MSNWNPLDSAPADGHVFEATDGHTRAYVCIIDEPDEYCESVTWFGLRRRRDLISSAGRYLYIAIPTPRGYSGVSCNTGWLPTHWREMQ